MNIPEAAIEAAGRQLHEYRGMRREWSELSEDRRRVWRHEAEVIIGKAAPFIAAQALRDAADATPEAMFTPFYGDPVDLNEDQRRRGRDRADRIGAAS